MKEIEEKTQASTTRVDEKNSSKSTDEKIIDITDQVHVKYENRVKRWKEQENDYDHLLKNAIRHVNRKHKEIPTARIMFDDARHFVWEILKAALDHRHKEFQSDGNVQWVLQNLIKYFIGDPSSSFPLHKGIYLFGDVGRGKSLIMWVLQAFTKAIEYETRKFQIVSVKDLMFDVTQKSQVGMLAKYFDQPTCFDDFGYEDKAFRIYGNEVSIMDYIITKRYDQFFKDGLITHVTTNVTPDKLQSDYGDRIASRCHEMFNFIMLDGSDKRMTHG